MIGPEGEILAENKRNDDIETSTMDLSYKMLGAPHHGTVMFSTEAYKNVGGYREEFYYAQDLDLWLRLSRTGSFSYVPEILYIYKISYESISCAKSDIQKCFSDICKACNTARITGKSEDLFLERARILSEQIRTGKCTRGKKNWQTDYYIGSCLLKRKDKKSTKYLLKAFKKNVFNPYIIIKLIKAFLL